MMKGLRFGSFEPKQRTMGWYVDVVVSQILYECPELSKVKKTQGGIRQYKYALVA